MPKSTKVWWRADPQNRQPALRMDNLRKVRVLLRPQLVGEPSFRTHDVVPGDRLIAHDGPRKATILREADWHEVVPRDDVGVIDRAVAREAPDAVEHLAGLQVPLRHTEHIAHRLPSRSDGSVIKDHGAGNRRHHLQMRHVERRIEGVQWTVSHLEVAHILTPGRVVVVGEHEGAAMRLGTEDVFHEPPPPPLFSPLLDRDKGTVARTMG